MKKRILSLLLAAALVLSVFPLSASAYVGDIPGVDYTRIEYNTILDQEVKFSIGSHEFTGMLSNGNRLEDEEVDGIIREFMGSYNITSEELQTLHAIEGKALKYDESREVPPRVLAELLLSACGVDNAETLSKILSGDATFDLSKLTGESVLKKLKDMAIDKLIDFALGKVAGETYKELFTLAKNVGTVATREYMEYVASDENAQRSFAAALALEKFYSLCNSRIKARERELGQAQWRLTCNESVITSKTLFGSILVPQIWKLAVDLKQTTPDPIDPNGWGGIYTGVVQLNVNHDMAPFDQQFLDKFFMTSGLPIVGMSGMFSYHDEYTAGSTMKRQLRNGNFSIQLGYADAENGQVEKEFSLAGFEDLSNVWISHPIKAACEYDLYNNGHAHVSVSGGSGDAYCYFTTWFHGEPTANNEGLMIDMYNYVQDVRVRVSARGITVAEDFGGSGMISSTIARDNSVYEELKGACKITISGVD
ncbi:MAG: hypothetical protein E7464_06485 [Ruminococcaceae bacterium]|nr:hypothetical protein [Oscillospiraceae bacterium]